MRFAYKFTGKERDSESGLDYFGARYYGSIMGRWMSPDPVGGSLSNPQSLNRYAYVLNNPLRLTDPWGLCPDDGDGTVHVDITLCFNGNQDVNVDDVQPQGLDSSSQSNMGDLTASLGVGDVGSANAGGGQNSFDPGSLAAGLFGAQGLLYWGNANAGVHTALYATVGAYGGAAFAPEIAGGISSATSWGVNATGLLGPTVSA